MQLRPYQQELVDKCREAFRTHNRVFMQLATGGGKTVIVSQMTKTASERGFKVWFIVPRSEILKQASAHFFKWAIHHSLIMAGKQESRAYNIHVISKDTLLRRIKKGVIKNYPDFCIFDEAHVAIDQQKFIIEHLPEHAKVLAISATPERTDGRGLSDIYQTIVYGPSIRELIEMGYLSDYKYFCPPLEGINDLHKKGDDVDAKELAELLKKRNVYGNCIKHYRKLADKQPCIVFCRNIKMAEETAHKFREAGYRFESIDGRMTDKQRTAIIDGVKNGALDGVTSVDLCIYGLDIPRLSVAIMLRPTGSKAVYYQQVGRILRPEEGKIATILDHVGNAKTHSETGDIPLNEDYDWKFYGKEKRKKKKGESALTLKLCPSCYLYFTGTSCDNCGAEKTVKPKNIQEIDGRLIEMKRGIPLKDRPFEERREYHELITKAKQDFNEASSKGEINLDAIKSLCDTAKELGRNPMWVYFELNTLKHAVNVPLLQALEQVNGYKRGWSHFKKKELQKRLG